MATMRQMKIALRRRMGEPLQGTWGKFRYEENRPGETTDELLETLNEAQDLVAREIYTPESYPFVRYDIEIPVVSGRDIYTMPVDFIAVEELRYIRRTQNYPMKRRAIKSVRYFNDRTYSGGVLQYYDYQGLINTYIAEGLIDESSDTVLIDNTGNFSDVRIGDIVYNLTDGSEGVVTSFRKGRVTVDALQGGRANCFRVNDTYAIATPEDTRWALQTYPRITTTDKAVYSGDANAFELSASDVIPNSGIQMKFDSLPSDYEDDEVISFVFYEGDTILEDTTGQPVEFSRDAIRIGYNTLSLPTEYLNFGSKYAFNVQLKENIGYSLKAFRSDGSQLPISSIKLSKRTEDRMLMTYARTPRRMVTDDSICEFPNEFNEAVYKRAKIILHEKLNNEGVSPQLYSEYDYEKTQIDINLVSRDESGPMEIDTDGEPIDYHRDSQWTSWFR